MERNRNYPTPLLSIVIATRNRALYAMSAIRNILESPDPRLELVIQDNSDNRDLQEWLQSNICDPRLHYHYTADPLSFVHNFDVAAQLASGKYLCFIGDDDGINPEIMKAASWAESMDLDALAVRQSASYVWPDTGIPSTLFVKETGGAMLIKSFEGSLVRADVEGEMRALLRNGGLYYLDRNLPKLYHGLVNRRCLKAVQDKCGVYFAGLSPDTFASLAISCVAQNVMVTDYPLTIPGACRVSGSVVEGQVKAHSKRIEDAPHLRNRGEYHWCEIVPRVYSVETIWVDSSIAALRAMGRDDLVCQLNIPKLAAYCIGANRGVTNQVLRDMFRGLKIQKKNRVLGVFRFGWSLLTGPGFKFAKRVRHRFLLIIGIREDYRIAGIKNIVEASHTLTSYLKEKGRTFPECAQPMHET